MTFRLLSAALLATVVAIAWTGDSSPSVPPVRTVGASLGLFATDPGFDYAPLLDELVDRGASDVLIVDAWVQQDVAATRLERIDGLSPSLATVERTIAQARARGLRVGVMPIIVVRSREPGQWRGTLAPDSGTGAWFEGYGGLLFELADVAQREGASRLVIGSELTSMQGYAAAWSALADGARARFRGTLTYSANWDAWEGVAFWSRLDEIGVSAYFSVGDGATGAPDSASVRRTWTQHLAGLEAAGTRLGLPVVLTEVGYPSHAEADEYPWDETRDAVLDIELQARLLGDFCQAEREHPLGGFYVWNWFGHGGPRDAGYAMRGKPSAAVFEQCMARAESGAHSGERR